MGNSNTGRAKNRGMMFHLAHLPATGSAIGQFCDPETDEFIKFLEKSKQTHWIINPLTPFGEDLSPYNSSSRFDRCKYFVNLNLLAKEEYEFLLKDKDLPDDIETGHFTLRMLQQQKDPRFKKAYKRFKKLTKKSDLKQEYIDFCDEEGELWLDDSSIYEGLVAKCGYEWKFWPDSFKYLPEKTRNKSFREKIKYAKEFGLEDDHIEIINQFRFEQFLFDKQFKKFKKKLDKKGIKLFVDLAYAISQNGKDVWSHKGIVELDENFIPRRLTGCPPECAYPATQVWGQAVWNYDTEEFWEYQENSIRRILKEGCVRLDHFGGLVNRGAIPTHWEDNGKVLYGSAIFSPVEHGGLGSAYWHDSWLEDVTVKKNSDNENLIDLYLRVAEEEGLNPEETFIVEDLGAVCATETFTNFMYSYGTKLAGLRLPITYGIDVLIDIPKLIDDEYNDSNPYNIKGGIENVALLSGSHDPPAIMEVIDKLLGSESIVFDNKSINSPYHFRLFCENELGLNLQEMNDRYLVSREVLKWLYSKPARHVQTTLSDALGIYYRPNMPGGWNGSMEKWNVKPNTEGLFPYWSKQFPKEFLTRDCLNGINPGYKSRVDHYISMMNSLFACVTV